MYYVYALRSIKDGKFYIGHTDDLNKRVKLHNDGRVDSTKFRRPFELVYFEASYNKLDTLKREKYLKTTYGHRYIKNRVMHYFQKACS